MKWILRIAFVLIIVIAIAILFATNADFFVSGVPAPSQELNADAASPPDLIGGYALLDRLVTEAEAQTVQESNEGRTALEAENGAVLLTDDLYNLGRDAFYNETFGNERFMTEVLGVMDGPLNLRSFLDASLRLGNQGTTNLQVPVYEDVTIGGQTFEADTMLNTGLDVPAGAMIPVGMAMRWNKGQLQVGITCAMCHAAVDEDSGKIIVGVPNTDLNAGLILAMASNSAAFFRHTNINPLDMPAGAGAPIMLADGTQITLPDPQMIEDAVDEELLAWMPGNFDSTTDLINNATQHPPAFTFGTHPYGYNGFASLGWFDGLVTLNSNVHATNSDPTMVMENANTVLGIDEETYLGLIFQNASNPDWRIPEDAQPSEFFETFDPTPNIPGMNEVVQMPNYPDASEFIVDGLLANSPDQPFAYELIGMALYQHSLAPPPTSYEADLATLERGAEIFMDANCTACHSGRYFTNNTVIPIAEIGTQPSRALSLAGFVPLFGDPQTYVPGEPVPIADDARMLDIPTDTFPVEQRDLAFVRDNDGGYKVPTLIGLYLSAPYLHDGGVAMGPDALEINNGRYVVANLEQVGAANTVLQWDMVDPVNSLLALIDRDLREAVFEANRIEALLQLQRVTGEGHTYWVDDEAGYDPDDQEALVAFLLSLDDEPAFLPPEILDAHPSSSTDNES